MAHDDFGSIFGLAFVVMLNPFKFLLRKALWSVMISEDQALGAIELLENLARLIPFEPREIAEMIHNGTMGHLGIPALDELKIHGFDVIEGPIAMMENVCMPKMRI